VNSVDKKYYCSHESEWKPRDFAANGMFAEYTWESDWNSRGRCTQQRFLYLLLKMRNTHPDASFYLLIDDDSWVSSTGAAQFLSQQNASDKFLIGYTPFREPGTVSPEPPYVWSGPGFIFSGATVKALDPAFLMTQASLWEFSCAFHDCCDYYRNTCQADDHPYIMYHFNFCNARLTEACGGTNTTDKFESCIFELDKHDEDDCHYNHTVPEHPVPMYYDSFVREVIWAAPPASFMTEPNLTQRNQATDEINLESVEAGPLLLPKTEEDLDTMWNSQQGCDHVLSFAARQAGAKLVRESFRLSWSHKSFDEWEREQKAGESAVDVCEVFAQHQLSTDEMKDFDKKWHDKCSIAA